MTTDQRGKIGDIQEQSVFGVLGKPDYLRPDNGNLLTSFCIGHANRKPTTILSPIE